MNKGEMRRKRLGKNLIINLFCGKFSTKVKLKETMEIEKFLSQLPVIQQVNELKNQVEVLRPFSVELEQRQLQKFRLDWKL